MKKQTMFNFCFHQWSKWSEPFCSDVAGPKVSQARKCTKCGKIHIAYVRSPWNWWFNVATVIQRIKAVDDLATLEGTKEKRP